MAKLRDTPAKRAHSDEEENGYFERSGLMTSAEPATPKNTFHVDLSHSEDSLQGSFGSKLAQNDRPDVPGHMNGSTPQLFGIFSPSTDPDVTGSPVFSAVTSTTRNIATPVSHKAVPNLDQQNGHNATPSDGKQTSRHQMSAARPLYGPEPRKQKRTSSARISKEVNVRSPNAAIYAGRTLDMAKSGMSRSLVKSQNNPTRFYKEGYDLLSGPITVPEKFLPPSLQMGEAFTASPTPNGYPSIIPSPVKVPKPDYSGLMLKNRPPWAASPPASSSPEVDSQHRRHYLSFNKSALRYTEPKRINYSNSRAPGAEPDWEDVVDDDNTQDSAFHRPFSTPDDHRADKRTYTKPSSIFLDPLFPAVLCSYLQVLFNLAMMSLLVYCVWIFLSTIRHDVDLKVEEYSTEILAEMALCSKEYIRNNCMPGRRVPALEKTCNSWEKCMNQDPTLVGRAKVSAETFGEIINSFLNPIGLKSMAFIVGGFAGSLIVVNYAFSYSPRPQSSTSSRCDHSMAGPQSPPPPPTPQPYLLYAPSPMPQTPGFYYTSGTPRFTPGRRAPLFASARKRK
jgi:hypothetical protein